MQAKLPKAKGTKKRRTSQGIATRVGEIASVCNVRFPPIADIALPGECLPDQDKNQQHFRNDEEPKATLILLLLDKPPCLRRSVEPDTTGAQLKGNTERYERRQSPEERVLVHRSFDYILFAMLNKVMSTLHPFEILAA